jgi:hypothetical protein
VTTSSSPSVKTSPSIQVTPKTSPSVKTTPVPASPSVVSPSTPTTPKSSVKSPSTVTPKSSVKSPSPATPKSSAKSPSPAPASPSSPAPSSPKASVSPSRTLTLRSWSKKLNGSVIVREFKAKAANRKPIQRPSQEYFRDGSYSKPLNLYRKEEIATNILRTGIVNPLDESSTTADPYNVRNIARKTVQDNLETRYSLLPSSSLPSPSLSLLSSLSSPSLSSPSSLSLDSN